jgi:5-formyltetrahydrofolate cyclo-ligase
MRFGRRDAEGFTASGVEMDVSAPAPTSAEAVAALRDARTRSASKIARRTALYVALRVEVRGHPAQDDARGTDEEVTVPTCDGRAGHESQRGRAGERENGPLLNDGEQSFSEVGR